MIARLFEIGYGPPDGPPRPADLFHPPRWQDESFDAVQLADPDVSSLAADPDTDGIPNVLEYAFGTGPLGMPVFALVNEGGILYQTLTYPRRRGGSRVLPEIYQPWFSDNLDGSWSFRATR